MAKGKRERRGGDPGRAGARVSDRPWRNPEEDPLRDLRPEDDEEPLDPNAEEYVWPDLTEENEEDD